MQRTASPSLKPLLDEETDMSIASISRSGTPVNTQQSWDQLRKEARTLESEIESKLATLTKIGQSTGLDNTGQEAETDDLLKKVGKETSLCLISPSLSHHFIQFSYKVSLQVWETF